MPRREPTPSPSREVLQSSLEAASPLAPDNRREQSHMATKGDPSGRLTVLCENICTRSKVHVGGRPREGSEGPLWR
eukprot:6797383-Alexandrium_andersonii.AAC.1